MSADVLLGLEYRSESTGSDLSIYPRVYSKKILENLETALYKKPNASIEILAEQVCADLKTPGNIAIFLANRQ